MLVRNLRGEPKWLAGVVLERTEPVSYRVQVGDQIWRRHTDQLLSRENGISVEPSRAGGSDLSLPWDLSPIQTPDSRDTNSDVDGSAPEVSRDTEPLSSSEFSTPSKPDPNGTKRYPSRIRNPPERLVDKYKVVSEEM